MAKIFLKLLGFLLIVVVLLSAASFVANLMFNQSVKKEVKELFQNNIKDENGVIHEADLKELPFCVQKWLEHSKVVGKERIKAVRLRQKGVMRTKMGRPWMPVETEQYFTTDEPGFIWKAKMQSTTLITIVGRDRYYEGKGNVLIRLLSLFTITNAGGKEVDQGALLRYLAETVWFPTTALNSYIKWEEIDRNSARATITHRGVTASGVFIFNKKHEVIDFIGERYREAEGRYTMETWSMPVSDYREFKGIRTPSRGRVVWKLKTGDFTWYRFEVTGVDYNKPIAY